MFNVEQKPVALMGFLGKGTYSKAWEVYSFLDKDFKAVKFYKKPTKKGKSEAYTEKILKEIQLQQSLKHPYILNLENYDNLNTYIVTMQECCSSSLASLARIRNDNNILLKKLDLVYEALQALQYLHKTALYLHLDVKLSNLLLGKDGRVKLSDFGTARKLSVIRKSQDKPVYGIIADYSDTNNWLGSPAYLSEKHIEAMLNHSKNYVLNEQTDLYAFGCSLYELFTGHLFINRYLDVYKKSDSLKTILTKILKEHQISTREINISIHNNEYASMALTTLCKSLLFETKPIDYYLNEVQFIITTLKINTP